MANLSTSSNRPDPKGFTLIEILVSIGILSILGGIGVTIYAITSSSFQRADAVNTLQSSGSQVLEMISRSVHSGVDLNVWDADNNPSDCTVANHPCEAVITEPINSLDYT